MLTKVRMTVAVLAVAIAVAVVGLPAARAHASIGPMTAGLRVTPADGYPGQYWVQVYGTVKMTPSKAQGLINSGHKVVVRLWGDDPLSDDLLMGPYDAAIWSYYGGLGFGIAHRVSHTLLNEDWGDDELYAGVRLVNSRGQTVRSAETNRVSGDF